MNKDLTSSHNIHEAHRVDHFTLMFAVAGEYHLKIDFIDLKLKAPFIFCLEPHQIHQVIEIKNQSGWVMAIDEFKLEAEIKNLLLTKLSQPLMIKHSGVLLSDIQTIMKLAFDIQNRIANVESDKF